VSPMNGLVTEAWNSAGHFSGAHIPRR
jgi:hypothetical protein